MAYTGVPSRVAEEEPRDIHVVYEAPLEAVPVQAIAPSEFDDEDEIEVESDPEEEPTEEEAMEDSYEPNLEEHMLGEYEERIFELDCRVQELGAEAQERESEFQKPRDEDHQRKLEMQELKVEISYRREAGIQLGTLFHRSVSRNVDLAGKLEEVEQRELSEKTKKEALCTQLELEVMDRIHFEEKWEAANERADDLEDEVRCKKRKMNKMGYVFHSAFERVIDGVYHYPAEQGQTLHTLSRELMAYIAQIEYKSAVERGMMG